MIKDNELLYYTLKIKVTKMLFFLGVLFATILSSSDRDESLHRLLIFKISSSVE